MNDRNSRIKYRVMSSEGFTLIELLLYIAIVGSLLIAVTGFYAMVAESRIKNQTISEVNQQGTAVMETITQAIRNANTITSPVAGASGPTLNLAMPTAGINPTVFDLSGTGTVLGYNTDGDGTDTSDSNFINATRFTASASGTMSTLFAHVGPIIAPSPNNKAQMAIYSGTAAAPTTLLASSGDQVLTASTWNSFGISPVTITSGQIYWLAYNTNGTQSTHNGLRYHSVGSNQSQYTGQTYGTWPGSWSGTSSATENAVYGLISSGSSAGAVQIKEGAGTITPLTAGNIQISNLTFKNLSRPGTPGVIQVTFTVSRVSSSGRNEYQHQKTFTSTAALR